MTLLRWTPTKDGVRRAPNQLGYGYRVSDSEKWNEWIIRTAGRPAAELEVSQRTLRVRDAVARMSEVAAATSATLLNPLPTAPVAATPAVTAPPAAHTDAVKERILALV